MTLKQGSQSEGVEASAGDGRYEAMMGGTR
jgi:hypothetical protein